jgi:hypothetical protein
MFLTIHKVRIIWVPTSRFGAYRLAMIQGLHNLLAPVHDAEHTRDGQVAKCLPHTCTEVLNVIKQSLNEGEARICWLKGPDGSGKSVIS